VAIDSPELMAANSITWNPIPELK